MTTPNKSLGQHWLNDEFTLNEICDFAGVQPGDEVLEIGPGLGYLSEVLLQRGAKVHAVEFDAELAKNLSKNLVHENFTIENADILDFDLSRLPKSYKVVANLPYYITSPIVRKLLEAKNPPQSATLLVQKEVAQRINAAPGEMSIMSVAAQFYADVRLGQIVPANLFTPSPKVDSQIIRLDYIGPKFSDISPKEFFKIVKGGFSERRKKLRSSLSGGLTISKPEVDKLLKKAEIAPDARAQELSLEDWYRLGSAVTVLNSR